MRKNQINGLIHDLLNLGDWKNPSDRSIFEGKINVNLISKEILGTDEEEFIKFYREKIDWFQNMVKRLDGLKDFQKANIFVQNAKEKVKIIFKGEEFSGEKFYGEDLKQMEKRFKSYG